MKVIIYDDSICEETFEICLNNISVYGGEYWDDSYQFSDYGIQLEDVTIAELTPEQYKRLGVQIIDHLLSNGHDFEFYNCNQGNGKRFKAL